MKVFKDSLRRVLMLLVAFCLAFTYVFAATSYVKADEVTDEEYYEEEEEEEEEEDDEDYEMDTVANFHASSIAKNNVTLKWDKVEDIDGYEISYRKSPSGKWTTKTVTQSKTSYKVTGLKVGTKYDFRIRAYIFYEEDTEEIDEEDVDLSDVEYDEDYVDDEEEEFEDYEYGGYAKMSLKTLNKDGSGDKMAISDTYESKAPKHIKTPSLKSVKLVKKGKAEVKWGKSSKASGYEVYMSVKKGSGYKKVATIKKAKTVKVTVKKSLKKGKTYYFKVRAFVKSGKSVSYTKYSKVKSLKVK